MSLDHRSTIHLVELTVPIIHALSLTDANKQSSDLANKWQGVTIYTARSAITHHVLDGEMEGISIHQQTGLLFLQHSGLW